MPRIDAHHHLWRYQPDQYPWMSDAMAVLRRDHLPEELEENLQAMGFDGAVTVQARQSLAETEWLLELANQHEFLMGVVGWVDLSSPGVGAQLERYAAHPKLVGVRHVLQDEPDDRFMLRKEFRAGIGRLKEFDLAYDLLIFPRHLRYAVELATEFPQQRFVLDHIAKPDIRNRSMEPWRMDMKALANCPNVWCKLSGMVTEAEWGKWTAEDFHPYMEAVMEAFGTERVMIGSDWPVCRLSGEYASTMGIVMEYAKRFPAGIQERLFGENCARFYGLPGGAK